MRIMATTKSILHWWLERHSNALAPDHDSDILSRLSDLASMCILVRFALFFPPLCLRQPLPRLGLFMIPPKLRRRFLRGCVVATAHGLATAPAGMYRACGSAAVYIGTEEQMIWMNRIFARVMSGAVMREDLEVRLQAAAAARIAGKRGIIAAILSGDVADVLSILIADANWVNERTSWE